MAVGTSEREAQEDVMTPKKTVKLTANLPEEVVLALKTMAGNNNVSMTEQLRRCIATENWLEEIRKAGTKIMLEDRNGMTREVVFR